MPGHEFSLAYNTVRPCMDVFECNEVLLFRVGLEVLEACQHLDTHWSTMELVADKVS
jgi:hypothetical protein